MEGHLVYYSTNECDDYFVKVFFVKVFLDKNKALEFADAKQKKKNSQNINVDYYVSKIEIVE